MCCDYRDIPVSDAPTGTKYNKITCLEMAEHVGVLKFNKFLRQVRMLGGGDHHDDGNDDGGDFLSHRLGRRLARR